MEALAECNGKVAFDEFVFGADERLRAAGIALAGGATKELAIDAAGFVVTVRLRPTTGDFVDLIASQAARVRIRLLIGQVRIGRSPRMTWQLVRRARRRALSTASPYSTGIRMTGGWLCPTVWAMST